MTSISPTLAVGAIVHSEVAGTEPDVAGTAFACSRRVALTAFHCVGDRTTGQIQAANVRLHFGAAEFTGTVVDGDHLADFAVISLQKDLPEEFAPVPLISMVASKTPFTSKGWPASRPFATDPLAISGSVTDPSATIFHGIRALQLYCREGASGLPLYGLSGAPVLVQQQNGAEAAAGIIRWNPTTSDDNRPLGGIAFACPTSSVLTQSDKVKACGFASADNSFFVSYAEEDVEWAEWVHHVLLREGHDAEARFHLLHPGDNYVECLSSSVSRHNSLLVIGTAQYSKTKHRISVEERRLVDRANARKIPLLVEQGRCPKEFEQYTPIDISDLNEEKSQRALLDGIGRINTTMLRTNPPFPGVAADTTSEPLLRQRKLRDPDDPSAVLREV